MYVNKRRRRVRIIARIPNVKLQRRVVSAAIDDVRLHPVAICDLQQRRRGRLLRTYGRSKEKQHEGQYELVHMLSIEGESHSVLQRNSCLDN